MKPDFSKKSTYIKIALILGLVILAPFLLPFTLDFIVVADLMGLEALIILLLTYSRTLFNHTRLHIAELGKRITETGILVAELYIFKPKVYLAHATVSSLVLVFACSVFMACVVWMPVVLASSGIMTV